MKIRLFVLLLLLVHSSFAITTENKLNNAVSYISSAIEDISGVRNTVIKIPVSANLTIEDVEYAMSSVATGLYIREVGILPLSEQVELQTNQKQKFLKVYQYADPLSAVKLTNYNLELSVIFPLKISLVESNDGSLWLVTTNLPSLIEDYGLLPTEIKKEIVIANDVIMKIMNAGATGDSNYEI